ncbi:MAG: hypothetical protein JXB07_04800 [Anaerolineae bacterium]|nr:hypothetical protein [Anaerolineae bacterium]
MPKVSAAEWRWVAVIGLIILLIFSLPYIVGLLASTPQMSFSGFLFGLEDMYSYIAKMRFGARDGWSFQLVYTSEPHQGGYVFLPFLALGKLAAFITGQGAMITAETLIITYHVARVLCGGLLLVVIYRFLAEFLPDVSRRRMAWCIALLTGGLGWIPIALNQTVGLQLIELYVPEGFSTLLLFGLPHLSLARAMLLVGWLALWKAIDTAGWRWAIIAGLAWLGMGIIVPFYVGLLGVLIAVWLATLSVTRRRISWPELRLAALAGGPPLVSLIYNSWLFTSNPVFAVWATQNNLPSPSPLSYLLAYGGLMVLGLPGACLLWRRGLTHRSILPIVWPLVSAVLVYLPINVQRRLLEGVIVPLSILAVLGMWQWIGQARWPVRWAAAMGALVLLLPSTVFLIGGGAQTASNPFWPVFHPADELAALRWLHDRAPADSVVLSTRVSGSILPAYAGVRVYLGHGPETVNAARKEHQVEAFFSDGMTDEERRQLLVDGRIAYVWVGLPEQELYCIGAVCFDPARLDLQRAYQQGDYVIYEVVD